MFILVAERFSLQFSSENSKSQYTLEDYKADLIHTRYALDYKQIHPKDFFRNSYSLSSFAENKDGLEIQGLRMKNILYKIR